MTPTREQLQEEADKIAHEAVTHTHFKTVIVHALERAQRDGRDEERGRILAILQEYAGDSGWVKLVVEKIGEHAP